MGNLDLIRGKSHGEAYQVLVNLMGSHDTPRFLHLCGSKEKQKLAVAFLLLMPGMPMIYYGDEYAMEGGGDPDNRRGMYWDPDHQDQEMFAWYKKLIQVRKAYAVITEGKTVECMTDDETELIVLVKELAGERIMLVFHNQVGEVRMDDLIGSRNLLTNTVFDGVIKGYEVLVLKWN